MVYSVSPHLHFDFLNIGIVPGRRMNLNNVKVPKVPGGGAISALLKVGIIGGLGLYGATHSLYNVDGGHRAIMFNRLVGIKDKVSQYFFIFGLLGL